MAYDDSVYGLTLDQWHRPGQTVVVNPTAHTSDFGIPSLPAGYTPIKNLVDNFKGARMVAVGSTVVILGGFIGGNIIGAGSYGYARKRLVGLNGGRDWAAYDLDSPWAWPVLAGAWVVGSRIYVASYNKNIWNAYTYFSDHSLDGALGLIDMFYSDDLGATWCNTKHPGIPCVGADVTDRTLNYDYLIADAAGHVAAPYDLGFCTHNGYFVVVQEHTIGVTIGASTYWTQGFGVHTLPMPSLGAHGVESRNFKFLGWFLPQGTQGAVLNQMPIGSYNYPTSVMDFPGFLSVGGSFKDNLSDGSYYLVPSKKWRMRFSDNMETVESFEAETNDTLLHQTTFGTCSYRNQRWVYGGGLVTTQALSEPSEAGNYGQLVGLTNRMLTSIDGDTWNEVSFGAAPPSYPADGFQNVPVRCRYPQMVFVPGTKEIFIGGCWIGQEYYNDTVGAASLRQNKFWMSCMHSSSIPFPDEVPDETPWYNYPLGGPASIVPGAPGESGDFTETGDLLRCLRVDLETGDLTVGSGYPLVSTLQNSSPTSLSGQIPDKMLAGDKYGYLNKAMVPEAPGLGNSSRYTLWTTLAGSTATVLVIDVTSRANAYLQSHFLTGLPIRVQWTDGSWAESTIADNGNDTVTLSSALSFIPAAGTKILIAPMDCAALLNETRYQYPARLVQARINVGNYQPDDQDIQIGIRTAQDRRRFGDFSTAASLIQTIRQRQLEAGGGVVGIAAKASRSLTYDLRFVPTGGGDLEIGPIILTENIAPGEKGLSQ